MQKNLKKSVLAVACATALLGLAVAPAGATGWTGANSSDWFDAANWSPATVPGASDEVIIDTLLPSAEIEAADASADHVIVGDLADGSLTIRNGGTLRTGALQPTQSISSIGRAAGSTGTVTVTGDNSVWTNDRTIFIGEAGNGTLAVLDGGRVTTANAILGRVEGGNGTLTISDSQSVFESSQDLVIGDAGDGVLVIQSGTVNAGASIIGAFTSSTGSALVEGEESVWNNVSGLTVGSAGNGTLSIKDGGTVNAGTLHVGVFPGSAGSVSVTNGGKLNSADGVIGDVATETQSSNGEVFVSGPGSVWNAADLGIGQRGNGTLAITNGGAVNSVDSVIGDRAGSIGTVTMDGVATDGTISTWTNTGNLTIGHAGTGALTIANGAAVDVGNSIVVGGTFVAGESAAGNGTLTILSDGRVQSGNGMGIGVSTGSTGEVIVNGENAVMELAGNFIVGLEGTGTFAVQKGEVNSGSSTIGAVLGGVGVVTVQGQDSFWTTTELHVGGFANAGIGSDGGTGTLTIRDGGTVFSATGSLVGEVAGSTGKVTVEGAGSTWANAGSVAIGMGSGGFGTLAIENGGAVTNVDGFVGFQAGSTGTVTVDGMATAGPTSTWTNTGNLTVGNEGAGSLAITRGGRVTSFEGFLGREAGSTGTMTVDGEGGNSTWTNQGNAFVGSAGNGTLTIQNGGTVSTGSASIASAAGSTGTLNIGAAAGEAAAGAGTLDTSTLTFGAGTGTLNFNHTGTAYDFNAAIAGAGAVNVLSGTTSLTAANAYTGPTTVSGGTLLVEGSLSGSAVTVNGTGTLGGEGFINGDIAVADGGTLAPGNGIGSIKIDGNLSLSSGAHLGYELGQAGVDDASDQLQVSGDLVLDGVLDITDVGGFGPGVYRLMNYGGALTDNGLDIGSRPVGVDATDLFVQTAFDGQINLISSAGAVLEFWDGNNAAAHDNGAIEGGGGTWNATDRTWTQADGIINGPSKGGFTVFGGTAGMVTVAGEQDFTGAQFLSDGYQLVAGNDGVLRSDAAETLLRVDPNVTATIAVPILGNTRLVKTDTGTLILQGASAYTGGVVVDGGRLIGDTGNLLGAIANRGELEFAQASDGAVDDAISGSGSLTKSGAGTLTFTGANTYTGGTVISGGTLRIGAGGTAGSLVGDVAIGAGVALVFDRSNDVVFGGALSGNGALDKFGAGTLSLGGNSAAFNGATSVHAGALRLSGALGGNTSIAAGARLSGNGALDNLVVAGTVAPGDSIGTLTVSGDFTQAIGSFYQAEIDITGQSDLIAVGGTAALNGGTLQVSGVAAPVGTRYTLLTAAGGVTGQYAVLDTDAAPTPFLSLVLNYAPNAVFLDVTRSALSFTSIGITRNQRATGAGLDGLEDTDPLVDAVVVLDTPQALGAFDLLSGELHASVGGALVDDSRFVRTAAMDRLRETGDSDGVGVWANLYDHSGDTDSDGNAARLDRNGDGVFVGADLPVGADWRLGLLAGYGDSRLQADERASQSSSEDLHAGIYGGGQWGGLGLKLGAAYSHRNVETVRNVAFADFSDQLVAQYDAQTTQLFAEAGYRFKAGRVAFEPYLALAQVELKTDGFQEQGGAAALSVAAQKTRTGFSTLGTHWGMDGGIVGDAQWNVQGTLGWRHAFGDVVPETGVRFADGDAFAIAGVPIDENALVVDLALGLRLSRTTSLDVAYSGQIGEDAEDHGIKARVQWQF